MLAEAIGGRRAWSSCRSAPPRTASIGSLDLQKVLRDGEHAFSPGLLARAHGGVLYVDEVNLLHDHLVDVLLDAAAMGRVHVERDGISHSHEARFVLIGTMNPEEGELRPQLLDRFGLTVDVHASRDVDVRVEVIRQRMAFEADPDGVRRALRRATMPNWPGASPRRARRIGDVVLPRQRVTAHRGAVCGVRRRRDARRSGGGAHRRRARRLARRGYRRREEDIRVAAELALPHRRRRDPFDDPGLDPEQLDDAMAQARSPPTSRNPSPIPTRPVVVSRSATDHREWTRRRSGNSTLRSHPAQRGAVAGVPDPGAAWCRASGEGAPGRRSRARNRTGTAIVVDRRYRCGGTACTCSARCWRPPAASVPPGRLRPEPDDVRRAIREGREGNLVIFVVDASGSMAARDRMSAVSGATLSLLRDAYQRRDKVAVITFRAAGRAAVAAADVVGAHRGPPAGPVRHRRQNPTGRRACWPPATWWCVRRRVTGRGAAWWWCSPTGGPPAAPTRWAARGWPRPGWSPRVPPRSSSTAKRRMCDWVWPSSWPASSVHRRCGWHSCAPTV